MDPLQWSQPRSHTSVQLPFVQTAVECGPSSQSTLQPPQFATSFCALVSQPFSSSASQSSYPASHVSVHTYVAPGVGRHAGVALTLEHCLAHEPQCSGVFNGVWQVAVPQVPKPNEQLAAQVPPTQDGCVPGSAVHPAPQLPQFAGSSWVFVSQPVVLEMSEPWSQLAYPLSHVAITHSPSVPHAAAACGRLHGSQEAMPQPVATSFVETHAPLQSFSQGPLPPLETFPPVETVPPAEVPPLELPPPPLEEPSSLVEPPHAVMPPSAPRNRQKKRTARV